MPATYEPIATTTLGSATATITFNSIPGTYTDLRLVIVGTSSGGYGYLRFNSDSGTNYSLTDLEGNSNGVVRSARYTNQAQIYFYGGYTNLGSNPMTSSVDIFSYAGSTNKTCIVCDGGQGSSVSAAIRLVGLWRSTSAITRIDIVNAAGDFNTGTTATIYGILKA
jgi:hypothetical protein